VTLPSAVLTLQSWKLTLPTGKSGNPTELSGAGLQAADIPQTFWAQDGAAHFRAPVNGVTTAKSHNCRCELRELKSDGKSLASWSSTDGLAHSLLQDMAFLRLPTGNEGVGVVGGQIHDADDDVAVWRCEASGLWLALGDHRVDWKLIDPGYRVGTRIQTAFVVDKGQVTAYYNGKLVHQFDANISSCYFRAGSYTQANAGAKPNGATNYGETAYWSVRAIHGPVPVIAPGSGTPPPQPVPVPAPVPVPVPTQRPTRIQIARHAEKPAGKIPGVGPDGKPDPHSLTAQGWKRAAGLVGLFDPPNGAVKVGLSTPTVIYAADGPSAGERMKQTASLLATALKLTPVLSFDKGKESNLAKALKALSFGTQALVVWEHSKIPAISKGLGKVFPKPPAAYPSDRFDVIWVYDLQPDGSWKFSQVNEGILPTDKGYVVSPVAGFVAAVKQAFGIGT
jgi:hypothetical protein